ncbi:FAD-dependent oxidoreductase [Haloferax marisrubri]|uniref:Thioredoxin reductase n=1 Tax=Haloferax marisrubri TaxID=1544719 RepID=A0A2P4NVP0_9EURY|nr:FAD-dependent oxidoreductase [Haloferax marisrubri]POG57190.1 thioredoxin reductase [Haloferax marisrubri]
MGRETERERECDVAVVGGGPAGCAAALCTARDGLDTVVFDGGDASLDRCAFLENYPGFPGGIDVATFRGLLHDQVREAGATLVTETVESVTEVAAESETETKDRTAGAGGFRVETSAGTTVVASRVVAATTLDGNYLRPVGDEDAMFERHVRKKGTHERFDGSYADADGRTPVEGLYVAGGLADRGDLVLLAAADGMRVGRLVVDDARREFGYWEEATPHMDWLRRIPDDSDDWDEERSWDEWFDYHRLPDDRDLDPDRVARVKARELAFVERSRLERDEIDRRAERGHRRLADHLDDEVLLDAVDDERIRSYLSDRDSEP